MDGSAVLVNIACFSEIKMKPHNKQVPTPMNFTKNRSFRIEIKSVSSFVIFFFFFFAWSKKKESDISSGFMFSISSVQKLKQTIQTFEYEINGFV